MRFKAAVVQMDCVPGDREANLQKALSLSRQAAAAGAKLVVLPEMFNTGYLPLRAAELAETTKSASLGQIQELAAKRDLYVVATLMERGEDRKLYITACLVSGVGIAATYRKVHLWGDEKRLLSPGTRIAQWNCRLGTMGPLICHDLEYPEQAARYPPMGAIYLVAPGAFWTRSDWESATIGRAREAASYLFGANRVGTNEGTTFCGRSRIVGPDGTVLADGGEKEGVYVASVDPEMVRVERASRRA